MGARSPLRRIYAGVSFPTIPRVRADGGEGAKCLKIGRQPTLAALAADDIEETKRSPENRWWNRVTLARYRFLIRLPFWCSRIPGLRHQRTEGGSCRSPQTGGDKMKSDRTRSIEESLSVKLSFNPVNSCLILFSTCFFDTVKLTD